MAKVDTSLKAEHVYICGDSGTGKSSTIKELVAKVPRVIVFDPDDEYAEQKGFVRVDSPSALVDILSRTPKGRKKIAFVGNGQKDFNFWCKCVFKWANCTAIAEEIADVTNAGKAPPDWGTLIRRGRKYGIQIIAVTQKPSEADKTILSNAAYIRTYALGRHSCREAVAREIDVKAESLRMIPLEWVEYCKADLSVKRGKLGEKTEESIRPPR